jgi:DNA adenine methylase
MTKAKPFIKWIGGKRQLITHLLANLPNSFDHYFECFVGGGALFFELNPKKATISDTNERLIRTYKAVRDSVEDLIKLLATYPHSSEFFYELRKKDIDKATDVEVAAWFIYLNKCGFNGLYRVNKKNGFNVPFGKYDNPNYCDKDNLRSCSEALANTNILVSDFETISKTIKPNSVAYFDPPYIPLSVTASFVAYTSDGFGHDEQIRLRNIAKKLKKNGVHVLLSNSSAPLTYELYKDFEIIEVLASRSVNSNGEKRGKIKELIIK